LDVVAIAKLPDSIKQDLDMVASCIGGAEHVDRIREMLNKAGYSDIKITLNKITLKENNKDAIESLAPGTSIDNYVASAIIEAIKN
jgi:hypothetical protein